MSDSVQPHRWQPTRVPCPWDSPGKNSGVGCHFLLQCMRVKSESEVAQSCLTPSDPMDCSPPGHFWNIPGLQLSHRKFMTEFFYICCYILISYYSEDYQMGNFIHWQSVLIEKGFGVINLMVNLCYLSKTFVSLNFRIAL